MHCLALLLSLAAVQDPQPASVSTADVVILENGARLEGTILEETPVYVRMQLGDDTIVGFERSRLATIERGTVVPGTEARRAALPAVDSWFVLHDADGKAVGWLHHTVVAEAHGGVRLGEEWQFRCGDQLTELTILEVADATLAPVSCFVHERTRHGDRKILHERVVRGTVEGEHLIVERRTLKNHDRTVYSFPAQARFLLTALEELRQEPDAAGRGVARRIYDPLHEEVVDTLFTTDRQRRVEWQGRVVRVRELVTTQGGIENREWLSDRGVLRREINGANLVALETGADLARSHAEAGRSVSPASFRTAGEHLGMWLPNPAWRFADGAADHIAASDPLSGAAACLLTMDQLDPGVVLDTAADTVVRWLRLVHRGFEVAERQRVELRGNHAVLLRGGFPLVQSGVHVEHRAEVYVFAKDGATMVLCLTAPSREFATASADLYRIRDSIELERPAAAADLPALAARQR